MPSKHHDRCLVCDDASIGINFGVPTCMPCKAFFRRHALRSGVQQFVCEADGDCLVTYKYRRLCNCCRLAKCFRVGMQKSLILSVEEREARNKLVEKNRLKRGKVTKRPCVDWMQSPSLLRITQSSIQCLSSSDQVVLANIFNAYENTCIAEKKAQLRCFSSVQHTSVHEFLNEISLIFPVFIEYFKHIPEFADIAMDDKIRLVTNHFGSMININEPLMHPVTSSNLIVTWTTVFGADITARLLKRNQIIEQYVVDPILLKLLLIILVLSSSNSRNHDNTDIDEMCDDILSIFAAQNIYVQLLWKYILSRSSSEGDAVKFFNKLTMFILYLQKLDLCIDGYINSLKDEVKQMEPLMQCRWLKTNGEDVTDINIAQDVIL